MAGSRPVPSRRALGWALVAALILPIALGAARADAATEAELLRARDRIDRTSAELAQARTAAERQGGEALDDLKRLERRLEAEKAALVALESGLERRDAREDAAEAAREEAEDPAAAPAAGEDGPVVVLGERPATAPAASTLPLLPNGGVRLVAERVPAVAGDEAATAELLDGYLASKASPLTGLGAVFVAESRAVGLDPRFLVAVSGAETSFGTYGPSQGIHNPFGMGPGIVYPSWSDAIRAAARNLAGGYYVGEGRFTIGAIQQRWAPNGASNDPTDLNSNWARNVSTYYSDLGGDPLAPVFEDAPPADAALPAAGPAAGATATGATATGVTAAPPPAAAAGPAAAEEALSVLGTRAVRGGDDPEDGFDAAGLVRWAYGRHGVSLPRSLAAQAAAGRAISPEDLESGDAIFFSEPSGTIVHAGLYLGDGQFAHAAGGEGETVKIASLYEPAFAQAYAGARRY